MKKPKLKKIEISRNVVDFEIDIDKVSDEEIIEKCRFILSQNKIPLYRSAIKNMVISLDFFIKTGREVKIKL